MCFKHFQCTLVPGGWITSMDCCFYEILASRQLFPDFQCKQLVSGDAEAQMQSQHYHAVMPRALPVSEMVPRSLLVLQDVLSVLHNFFPGCCE